jgi:hypothetical protein
MRAAADRRNIPVKRVGVGGMADELDFHLDRWMAELNLASRARHPKAAKAHLGLSTLHFQRMLDLRQERFGGTGLA